MKHLVLAHLFLSFSAAFAAPAPSLDIYEFTREALALDGDYQDALFDQKISEVRKDAAANLYRGKLELGPYIDRYDNEATSYFSSTYKEEGVKGGYTQFTPLGTALVLGYGHAWENTRSTSLATENYYTVGIIQPLLRNSFGLAERSARAAFETDAEAAEARALAVRNDACGRATDAYVDSYTQEKRASFVQEVLELASELQRKGAPAFKTGQIGKLDWWGVQAEYLNLQDQKSQSDQLLLQRKLAMLKVAPSIGDRALADPTDAFQKMLVNLKSEQKKEPTHAERYYEKQYEANKLKAKSERSWSRPNLDLKVTQYTSDGKIVTSGYEDKNLTASLQLTWQLNDGAVDSAARIAQLEAERALFKSREIARVRQDRYKEFVQGLIRQAEQIEYEKKRATLLGQITEENKRRFLQGRVDFQDFLRVREQWFDTQTRLLEKQASYWKNLASFSLIENFPLPFCQE